MRLKQTSLQGPSQGGHLGSGKRRSSAELLVPPVCSLHSLCGVPSLCSSIFRTTLARNLAPKATSCSPTCSSVAPVGFFDRHRFSVSPAQRLVGVWSVLYRVQVGQLCGSACTWGCIWECRWGCTWCEHALQTEYGMCREHRAS